MKLPHNHCKNTAAENIPDTESFRTAADVFRQLSDTTRVKIFWILCHGEECITNLSAAMNMTSPAVSHHIRQLKDNGLIVGARSGKEVLYRAADTDEARLLHIMIEKLIEINCPAEKDKLAAHSMSESAESGNPIEQVHTLLVSDLTRHFTIEELSRLCLINTTTLKARFKSVYGKPIATYMKEYRMRHAARLLRSSDDSVAQIAAKVGYGTQSKFTEAFKSVMHTRPLDYRKSFRA